MKKMGVIEEANDSQQITSNMLVVRKKNNDELCCVIDWRLVNEVTIPSNRSIPRIEDILQKMNGKKYFAHWTSKKHFGAVLFQSHSQGSHEKRFSKKSFSFHEISRKWKKTKSEK